MDSSTFFVIGFVIALCVYVFYRQQKQIREQNEKINKLEKAVEKELTSKARKGDISAVTETPTVPKPTSRELAAEPVSERKQDRVTEKPKDKGTSRPEIPPKDPELEITPEFERGLELLSSDSPCIFITGKAGTGKSRLLKYFMESTNKSVALVAPTGMAAILISGQTIHSFFGFPGRTLTDEDIKPSRKRELYKALDTIIIDEISMVRADLLDRIDQFLRLNGPDMAKPFGGVQMVFFGDLYQLPPVVSDEDESKFISSNYDSPFFFDAHVIKRVQMEKLELTIVFRQKDGQFVNALNAVRTNTATVEILDYINRQHIPVSLKDRNSFITLVTTNADADQINQSELAKIPRQQFTYYGVLEGEFAKEQWKNNLPVDVALNLKEGAQVIFVKNDMEKRWINGDKGRIIGLSNDYVRVEMDRDGKKFEYVVNPDTWELIKYKFDYNTRKIKPEVVGKYIQYPLRLGWAITIHKSQGATLDCVHVDFGNGAFASGQAYVALSRCKSLQGLTLERPLSIADIKSDPSVKKFMTLSFSDEEPFTSQTVTNAPQEHAHQKARFVSDKIDEEHKYGQPRHGTPDWFVDDSVEMVLPLFSDPEHGLDLRKYHGECKIYSKGKFCWIAKFTDAYSIQAFWRRIQSFDDVSVEPVHLYQAASLRSSQEL